MPRDPRGPPPQWRGHRRQSPSPAHVARASLASTPLPHSAHNWRGPGPSALTGRFSAGSPTQYLVELSWGFWKAVPWHSDGLIPRPPPTPLALRGTERVMWQPGRLAVIDRDGQRGHFANNVHPTPTPTPWSLWTEISWVGVTGELQGNLTQSTWGGGTQQVYSQPELGSRETAYAPHFFQYQVRQRLSLSCLLQPIFCFAPLCPSSPLCPPQPPSGTTTKVLGRCLLEIVISHSSMLTKARVGRTAGEARRGRGMVGK